MSSRPSIVLVGNLSEALPFVRALKRFQPLTAKSGTDALAWLGASPASLVIADFHLPDMNGVAFLEQCATESPSSKRVLMASYADLATVVRSGFSSDVAHCILPKGRWSQEIQNNVLRLTGSPSSAALVDDDADEDEDAMDWEALNELVRKTIAEATKIPRMIVRPLPHDRTVKYMQLVLPKGRRFDRFRCELPLRWQWPIANLGQMRAWDKEHPVIRELGRLFVGQEVYVKKVRAEQTRVGQGPAEAYELYVYVAILPWQQDRLATLVIGLWSQHHSETHRRLLEELHGVAVNQVPEFCIPAATKKATARGVVDYIKEYDWVVTGAYVGPDRRIVPTGFINRHLFVGKRAAVPQALARVAGSFVDRLPPRAMVWVGCYLVLSAIDTVLTFVCVRRGVVMEANPLLRALVHGNAWLFLLAKNALSIGGLFLVVRFHLFRTARLLLPANVAIYALLVAYWVWLLTARVP